MFRKFLSICLTVWAVSVSWSQIRYETHDFTVFHSSDDMQLLWKHDTPLLQVEVLDVIYNRYLSNEHLVLDGNSVSLQQLPKGRILKLTSTTHKGMNVVASDTYLATTSASTGRIHAFFNHNVNHAMAYQQPAHNIQANMPDSLKAYMDRCQHTMDIAIYNSVDAPITAPIIQAINDAHNRGVRIRIVFDGSANNTMLTQINPNIPRIASPTGQLFGLMHNKFVVFDAMAENPNLPTVWTGSTNWTQNQINGTDRNNVITIQDQSLALAFQIEFEEMWGGNGDLPNPSQSLFGPFKTANTPVNFLVGGKFVECLFSPTDGVNQRIIGLINGAQSDVNVATMLITRADISDAIIQKHNSGVPASHVMVSTQNPMGNQFLTLQAALPTNQAIRFNQGGTLHHKFMVVDHSQNLSDARVLTGSHNWSSNAETRNDENTVIVHDTNIANQYFQALSFLFLQTGGVFSSTLSVENPENNTFTVYPNPVRDWLYVSCTTSDCPVNYVIYDMTGKRMQSKALQPMEAISFESLHRGVYVLELRQVSGAVQQMKVVRH